MAVCSFVSLFFSFIAVGAVDVKTGERTATADKQAVSFVITAQGDVTSPLSGLMRSEGAPQHQLVAPEPAAVVQQEERRPTYNFGRPTGPRTYAPPVPSLKVQTSGYRIANVMNEARTAVGWSAGAQCDIPRWNSVDFACKEAAVVLPMNDYVDKTQTEHRLLNHGQKCSCQCAKANFWEEPNITQMQCLNGRFVDSENVPIHSVACATTWWIWALISCAVALVLGICCSIGCYCFVSLRRSLLNGGKEAEFPAFYQDQDQDPHGYPLAQSEGQTVGAERVSEQTIHM